MAPATPERKRVPQHDWGPAIYDEVPDVHSREPDKYQFHYMSTCRKCGHRWIEWLSRRDGTGWHEER